ncbi:MAG: phage Gp19/Gp15/Gp42 family protein [Ruthenibacterium sp.]
MRSYATLDDITQQWRLLTQDETRRAVALLPVVSASLRCEAAKVGKNLDVMVDADVDFAAVATSVTVDVVTRTIMTSTNQEPMTQLTQSAGGYSASGTFLVPGGGLFIKRAELARLGLRKQRYGGIDFYGGTSERH